MELLAVTNFNIILSVLGGWITFSGLFSSLLKEQYYLSEAVTSLLAGAVFSHVFNLLRPLDYAGGSPERLGALTLDLSRLVLGVQLVIAGVQLPRRYLRSQWRPLSLLLGPGMLAAWACSSAAVWVAVPGLPFLHALAVGACVTPTDPILAGTIVKGRFADENVPEPLRDLIVAESGANDGLGYPFLFIALYLIKHTGGVDDVVAGSSGSSTEGGAGAALWLFLWHTCGYVVLLSAAYGWVVGWAARAVLRWAERRRHVDRESLLVFAVPLALFVVGTCGMAGSDDVLACFVAGNAFTWDDWFRLKTVDDPIQPTVDMLLNVAMFMWLGAACPWASFWSGEVVGPGRLAALGVLVLLFRRLPAVLGLYRHIHQIEDGRQALFAGHFGPIGVSAIFYLYVGLEFLQTVTVGDAQRPDAKQLGEVMTVVIWFLVICSVVVHGLSVPAAKLGFRVWAAAVPRPSRIALPS
ncbi:hypothetical protein RB595_004674 [Gaeumannomyces hyphopodioides]